jgi:hypothetical protein
VTQPAHSRPRVAPVVGVAPEAAPVRGGGGAGTQLAALLSAPHILKHTVHCLEDAAAHLPEVAEAAHVLYAVGLHVERVGGGCKEGGGAEPVHLGEETLPRSLRVARRPAVRYLVINMLVTGLVHYGCYIAAPSESFKAHKYLKFSALKF